MAKPVSKARPSELIPVEHRMEFLLVFLSFFHRKHIPIGGVSPGDTSPIGLRPGAKLRSLGCV